MKKFKFGPEDDIYKIFQLLDKLPKKYKEIYLYIDPKNPFFSNKWWVKLVIEKGEDKGIKINFIIENSKQELLMKAMNVPYTWKKVPIHQKLLSSIKDFFSLFKSKNDFYKKHYKIINLSFLVLEFSVVIFIIYFVYNLVTPKTDVYIQPAVNIKTLVKKFYIYPENENYKINSEKKLTYNIDSFSKTYTLKISVNDISYEGEPAEGTIKFINYMAKGISLKAHTLMKTKYGLLFRLKNWVYIPPKNGKGEPGIAYVKVKAEEKDENGKIIGSKGNLSQGTRLYVKKLYVSYGKKQLIAEASEDFKGGKTISKGEVSLKDIEYLKKQLLEKFKQDTKKAIFKYIQLENYKKIPLVYDKLYGIKDISYDISTKPGDKSSYVEGDIKGTIYFAYLDKEKIKNSFKDYLQERLVSENEFLGFDNNNIEILDIKNLEKNLYLINISMNAMLGYDFNSDYNYILPKILEEIKGKKIEEAKNIITSYPMVAGVEIKNTSNIDRVSKLKSRIFIHIVK